MTLALKEWHVVCEAIARGDQVLTLRKGGIRERDFALPGSGFWLFPTWEHETPEEIQPAWHGELARSLAERPADGSVPLRCHVSIEQAWELDDPDRLAALDALHLWTPAYARKRLAWRPTKPLRVLLLRASSLLEPVLLPPSDAYGGCRSWLELDAELPTGELIPSLTDEAFELRADVVRSALDGVAEAVL